jgi:peptidoglycan/xylan/chitin deacetylase (PgdA/CDA1 family)
VPLIAWAILISGWPPDTIGRSQHVETIYVALRVDDIFMSESPIKPQEIDAFIEICEKHGAKVMLAVIPHRLIEPQNSDGEMAKALRRVARRGHQVSLHSYTHRCSLCGSTGHEYNCDSMKTMISRAQEERELRKGKRLLEDATGKSVTTFVGAGTDDQLHPQTFSILKDPCISWVTLDSVVVPQFRDTVSFVPNLDDYTWDLRDSTYGQSMSKAKADFVKAIQRGNYFSICFDDHFTRKNFNGGIVLRWTDELLGYVTSYPGVRIHFVTIDDLKKEWFASRKE